MKCNCCNSKKLNIYKKHFDNNSNQNYSIYLCDSCKSAFVYPYPSESFLANFYINGANIPSKSINEIQNDEKKNRIIWK